MPPAAPVPPDISESYGPNIRRRLAGYRRPQLRRSVTQLSCSLALFLCGWLSMWVGLSYSYLFTLALAVPTAGFLARLFMIQHDCGHGSFFRSRRVNDVVGCLLGVLTFTPYHQWRRIHALHHATSGNLDRRGHGDIWLLTSSEYRHLSPLSRLGYRIYRHPLFLFLAAPVLYFVFLQRLSDSSSLSRKKRADCAHLTDFRSGTRERLGVHLTTCLMLGTLVAVAFVVGWRAVLAIHIPIAVLAASIGMWLFHVQHAYETTYWKGHEEWDYFEAAAVGSSYYRLPKILQWFTANIGFHHIHHLDSRIPNYRLPDCFDAFPELRQAQTLTLVGSLRCASLSLWDEDQGRLIRFDALTRPHLPSPGDPATVSESGRPRPDSREGAHP